MCLSNILRDLIYVATSLSICLIEVYTGLERSAANDSSDFETQSGAGFANSTMQDETYSSDFETQSGAGFANSATQDEAGFSHTDDKIRKDEKLTRSERHSKDKVLRIMNDMIHLTVKQRKFAKQLIRHIEANDEINCNSTGEGIFNDNVCTGSNIYELICHKIQTSCAERLNEKFDRRGKDKNVNWIPY